MEDNAFMSSSTSNENVVCESILRVLQCSSNSAFKSRALQCFAVDNFVDIDKQLRIKFGRILGKFGTKRTAVHERNQFRSLSQNDLDDLLPAKTREEVTFYSQPNHLELAPLMTSSPRNSGCKRFADFSVDEENLEVQDSEPDSELVSRSKKLKADNCMPKDAEHESPENELDFSSAGESFLKPWLSGCDTKSADVIAKDFPRDVWKEEITLSEFSPELCRRLPHSNGKMPYLVENELNILRDASSDFSPDP